MLQTFDATTSPDQSPPRLKALRAAMADAGVDAFLVPRADAHQGEYVAPADERLAWLTGFTGSAGSAAVTGARAALFADGRYRVQGRAQVPDEVEVVAWPDTKVADWLIGALSEGGKVGLDPWLHTEKEVAALRKALDPKAIALAPGANLIDAIWPDRPAPPVGEAFDQPVDLTGRTSREKREEVAGILREADQKAVVLTLPDSISWLLNIRGSDIPRNPVVQAFAILHEDARVDLFLDPAKVEGLDPDPAIAVHAPAAMPAALAHLSGPVRVDPETAPFAVFEALREAGVTISEGPDPCLLPKARKTPAELRGARDAHRRDGAAMARFLHWLDANAPGDLTEIAVVEALEGFRRGTNALRDISFETIAGSGPHGAIVHYRVTRGTDRPLRAGELLLVDSGGQYVDGTTDITRTVPVGPVGPVGAEERAAFTAVLRGMIAVSRARFPKGCAGRDVDPLARQFLWVEGRDYDHGTGHGVGSYLSVHEGPARISRASTIPLEAGMILSNEPGYYREGQFGIRIENLVAVRPAEAEPGREFLGFETLTLAPIDRRLVDARAMAPAEVAWLDAYHARVLEEIGPLVEPKVRGWLARACAPLRP
ncbi:Xaa-Pro aminopeptidase [Hasllibacter halocynthiae]|uniref:Xaa-Pro aminopeptidase n=1 Tax=Hasllibacter halocynthiae TaxID=595589 RepID=A0A2T0X9M0_9RHOB|nr:aminopeptidase P family protein [Hasllibacter halocynthiae]PRY95564.1 Xaa-Pro aminopeptidase [Hasllibacter halocynthiae]